MSNWNVGSNVVANYLNVCKTAAENEELFQSFKRSSAYKMILEHCSYDLGKSHLKNIKEKNPGLLEDKRFFQNDLFGDPEVFDFGFGVASPTTIQYISVLANLICLFGDLTGYRIVEIGAGYGGQAKVIGDKFEILSYTMVDLHEATLLQNKYINKLGIKNAKACTYENFSHQEYYDLVISNYALSEVLDPLQTEYVEKILLKSKHGYLTCNGPIHAMEKMVEKFPIGKSSDIEGERKSNFIITW